MSAADPGAPKSSLRGQIARGAGWMVLSRAVDRSMGLISTLVLARLLIPGDFGIVAMSMSVVALIELLSAFNLSLALIQRHEPPRELFDTAWTLNLLLAVGCALLMCALAYPAALFFREPRLALVILALAGTWAIEGAQNIGVVHFRREMNFAREFNFMALRRVVGFLVTLALAFWWRNYWALVGGILAKRLTGLILSFTMHPFRPRWSLNGYGELFSYSSWLLLNNFLHFLYQRLGHLIIGRALGSGPLGIYTIASDLSNFVTRDFIAPVNRAVFPGLSRMAQQAAEMKSGFLDVVGIIAVLVFPAAVGMASVAEPLVLVALGERWLDAVPIVAILAMAGILNGLTSHNYSAYLALGQTGRTTLATGAGVVFLVPMLLLLATTHGLAGVAYAVLAAVGVELLASCLLLLRSLRISVLEYTGRLIRPLIAAVAMGLAVHLAHSSALLNDASPAIQLAALVLFGAVVYVAMLLLLWISIGRPAGAEHMLWNRIRSYRPFRSIQTPSQP